eukprot:9504080-Pyramimonas_sp.AAC.2
MFLEHKSDVLQHDSRSQNCSKNISLRPQKVLRTFCGGPTGQPGRLATACLFATRVTANGLRGRLELQSETLSESSAKPARLELRPRVR